MKQIIFAATLLCLTMLTSASAEPYDDLTIEVLRKPLSYYKSPNHLIENDSFRNILSDDLAKFEEEVIGTGDTYLEFLNKIFSEPYAADDNYTIKEGLFIAKSCEQVNAKCSSSAFFFMDLKEEKSRAYGFISLVAFVFDQPPYPYLTLVVKEDISEEFLLHVKSMTSNWFSDVTGEAPREDKTIIVYF